MHFNSPEFKSTRATTLVVLLHAYGIKPNSLNHIINTVKTTYDNDGVDIYAPLLPYQNRLDATGANNIVIKLVEDLDEIWAQSISNPYQHVIFIGHSLGGILLRRLFLAGAPNSPDYANKNIERDDLPENITGVPHDWSTKIERIILLASWDKGWSLSDSVAWKYSFSLNVLGFCGRIAELLNSSVKPGRTMLDMRLGAPFIVQTRLLWMAYRRWHNQEFRDLYNEGHPVALLYAPPRELAIDPLVIQLIGSKDDFVSPQDQVDYDVNVAANDAPANNYYLIEMPGADHPGVVNFVGDDGDARKEVFLSALTGDRNTLAQVSCKPGYFEDMPTTPDPSIKDVIVVMHGIRDDGYWTHRIAKKVKEVAEYAIANGNQDILDAIHTVSWTKTYGYFPMGAFLLPWVRQQKVEWFMDNYISVKARYPNATMHYVGHSNGTYLAAKSLDNYAAARFGRVYFAGSVVNPKYEWCQKIQNNRVKQMHNARGATDWVVALLPKSVEYISDLGGAGFDGFEQASLTSPCAGLTQSHGYAKGGHSGAITEYHWTEIAKFIVTGNMPFSAGEPSNLFDTEQHSGLKMFARLRIGIPLIFSLVALLILWAFSLWLPNECRQNLSNFTGGLGFKIWGALLLTFLSIQYLSKKVPIGVIKWLSCILIFVIVYGISNVLGNTFFQDAITFTALSTTSYSVAFRTAGSVITLASFAILLRFILNRF